LASLPPAKRDEAFFKIADRIATPADINTIANPFKIAREEDCIRIRNLSPGGHSWCGYLQVEIRLTMNI
jgi:hypothetical protein